MIDCLSKIGGKLASFLKSPQFEAESLKCQESLHEIFSFDSLSSMLFFESVEIFKNSGKDHTFFVSKGSVGFVIESSPIVGGGDDLHRTILELIDELLEENVSIQGLLLADHKINDYLKSHAKKRAQHGELFFEMIRQRSLHFKNLKSNHVRNFRFIFSLSMPKKPSEDFYLKLIEKKKRALKTFKDLSPSFSWDENAFLTTVSALINFSQSTIPDTRKLNPLESFSSQLPKGGSLAVTENGLVWEKKNPVKLKTYRAVDFPDYWSINSMNKLIGSFEKDKFKINAPFYIHYGIYCPPQASIERSYSIRSNIIEKQSALAIPLSGDTRTGR